MTPIFFISVLLAALLTDVSPHPPPPPTATPPPPPTAPKKKIYYTSPVKKSMLHPVSTPGVPVTRASEFLNAHNKVRAQYGEPPLSWNATLAKEAMKYTAAHAFDCKNQHTTGPYGENMFWSGQAGIFTPSDVVEKWFEEKSFFDEKTNGCIGEEECGHFVQLVWLDTKSIGCSIITCHNGGMVTMCFYYPPGNYYNKSPFKKHLK